MLRFPSENKAVHSVRRRSEAAGVGRAGAVGDCFIYSSDPEAERKGEKQENATEAFYPGS